MIQILTVLLSVLFPVVAIAGDVNVLDFGARTDNTFDNTAAFQAAIDRTAETGGVVSVPAGCYRFNGSLVLRQGVTIEGSFHGPHTPDIDRGTTLLINSGRDREDGTPFLAMKSHSTVKGISFYYPDQRIDDIRPYPWTIQQQGERCNLIDLAIANAYNAIDCGTIEGSGHFISNIHLYAARRGLYIDRCYDIGRVENVHMHPASWITPDGGTGAGSRELWDYCLQHMEGFIIGRTDWQYIDNCFVIFPNIGFHFIETPYRPDESPQIVAGGNVLITQSGPDLCLTGVRIEKAMQHAGIAFENCQFMSGMEIGPENTGPVKLTNCGFWGVARPGSHILNEGSGTTLLSTCHFTAWDDPRYRPDFKWDPKVPFIDMRNGSLSMTTCLFKDYEHTPEAHIRLGEKVIAASIVANICEEGPLRIDNRSSGDVRLTGNR